MPDIATILPLVAFAVALVATVRKFLPTIDGRLVGILALACSLLVAWLFAPGPPRDVVVCALSTFVIGFGGMTIFDRAIDKIKPTTIADVVAPLVASDETKPHTEQP